MKKIQKKTELNNDEWVSCDVELNRQMKNTNADTAESDQNRDTADVFDNDNVIKKWRKIHSFDKIADQEKMSLISKDDNVKKHWILNSVAWQKRKKENNDKINEEEKTAISDAQTDYHILWHDQKNQKTDSSLEMHLLSSQDRK